MWGRITNKIRAGDNKELQWASHCFPINKAGEQDFHESSNFNQSRY